MIMIVMMKMKIIFIFEIKMGKGKKKHNTERDIKAQKRNERRNLALGTLKNQNINKYKTQNEKIPKLISQKQKIKNGKIELKRKK